MYKRKFISQPHEVAVPTLLIGIGGIGGRILSAVNDSLGEIDRKFVQMVALDTNLNDLQNLEKKGISYIQTSKKMTVQEYLMDNEHFLEWFPVNQLINSKNLIDGAGQIRSVSRLGALASKDELATLGDAIEKVSFNYGDSMQKAVKIMIVGSISGGTGSGLGIQLPFYIRKLVKEKTHLSDVLVRGLFLTPSVVTDVQQTKNSEDAMYVNGYAFVRELNAFYRAQAVPDEEIKVDIEYYEKGEHNKGVRKELHTANQVPYNFMFLIEKADVRGRNIGSLAAYEAKAAKIVKSQLFSSVASDQFSAEDNLIIAAVEANGMNRYCGAGTASAVYPYYENLKYCALKYCNKSVSDLWLSIDRDYEIASNTQQEEMLFNPTLEPIQLAEYYMSEFEKRTQLTANLTHYMAMLRKEIYAVTVDEQTEERREENVIDAFIDSITDHIEETQRSLGLDELRKKCQAGKDGYSYDKIEKTVREILSALETYRTEALRAVNKFSVICGGEIFPQSLTVAREKGKDAEYSFYNLLAGKHPMAARYILYKVKEILSERKEKADGKLSKIVLNKISKTDYYDESDGVLHSPMEALAHFGLSGLKNILHQASGIALTGKDFENFSKRIQADFEEEISSIDAYKKNKFEANVFKYVIDKIDIMIALYEKFFTRLSAVVEDNNAAVRGFERASKYRNGDLMICADGDCKKDLNREVERKMSGEAELSFDPDIKAAFLDEMYKIFGIEVKRAGGDNITEAVPEMGEVFEAGIFAPMKNYIEEKAGAIIDLGIMGAIEKEFEVKKGLDIAERKNTMSDIENAKDYTRRILTRVSEMASPFIAYRGAKDSKIAVSWGINRDVALAYQGGAATTVDMAALDAVFDINSEETCMIEVAPSFAGDELVCYKSVYNLGVNHLLSFAKNGKYETKYNERLHNIITGTYEIETDKDGYLTSVHPHLDKRWYNRGYLPLLHTDADDKVLKECDCAFLLGMGMDFFSFSLDEDYGDCWRYKGANDTTPRPILIDGKAVEKPYHKLLDAMRYNEVIREQILKYAAAYRKKAYNEEDMKGATEESVVKELHTVIHGIINTNNILDIIINTYSRVRDIKLAERLIGNLVDYITEYCGYMLNNKAVPVRNMTLHIAKCIETASKEYAASTDDFKGLWTAAVFGKQDVIDLDDI